MRAFKEVMSDSFEVDEDVSVDSLLSSDARVVSGKGQH
jgi:hypothetical protein